MICNLIPLLRKKYPDYTIDFYTKTFGLETILKLAGVDNIFDCSTLEPNNYETVKYLIGYPIASENYPNNGPIKKHLLEYFADELGLDINQADLPKLDLKLEPVVSDKYITLQNSVGWSPYKQWGPEKWEQVVANFPTIKFIQIGTNTDIKIKGCDHSFMGNSLITAAKLISNAKLHLGGDSMGQHIAYQVGVKSIILWGSTQCSASGYKQNININLGLSCQPCWKEWPGMSASPNGICENPPNQTYENPCHACMAGITPDMVISELSKLLLSLPKDI